MDFSGVTIFRHTITMIVVVWRLFYGDEMSKSCEGGYDERYFYEREADFTASDINGITDGSVHAGKFTL